MLNMLQSQYVRRSNFLQLQILANPLLSSNEAPFNEKMFSVLYYRMMKEASN
jgi:hypothetical protein